MQSAGVDARNLTASFLHDTQLLQRNGQTPDFSNTLFLLSTRADGGLADMASPLSSPPGGGRAVSSGILDQLPPIASGQAVQADGAAAPPTLPS